MRFGLGAVRGVGGAALETVFDARKEGGPFKDMFDFASRVDAKKMNKGVLEALVQCGAFDRTLQSIRVSRAQAFLAIELALERLRSASRDREVGQTNLFGLLEAASTSKVKSGEGLSNTPRQKTGIATKCLCERQVLGFYVSGHPLERYLKGTSSRKA